MYVCMYVCMQGRIQSGVGGGGGGGVTTVTSHTPPLSEQINRGPQSLQPGSFFADCWQVAQLPRPHFPGPRQVA